MADVVVIGGGIAGSAFAKALARTFSRYTVWRYSAVTDAPYVADSNIAKDRDRHVKLDPASLRNVSLPTGSVA